VKKLKSLKHRVRSQITRLKLQKSFCDLEHGLEYYYEYSTYNSHHINCIQFRNTMQHRSSVAGKLLDKTPDVK